jgi:ribosomal-protein-alanine N-acetyltransferase
MIIQGKNILLRTVRERDLEQLYPYHTDLESRGPYFPIYIPSESEFRRIYNESGFWTEDNGDVLICDLQDNLLGMLIFFKSTPYFDGYEIGYRLFNPQENGGRGITSEALILLTYVLFAIHKINRLELKIVPENQASKRVAQKAGYQYEGIARGAAFLRGRYVDLEVWSILRSEAPGSREEALERIP